jgi:GNAT superfamily N-acetyltransferase
MNNIIIRPKTNTNHKILENFMSLYWGGEPLIVHGKKYFTKDLEGYLAFNNEECIAFLLFERQQIDWEIIVFESYSKFSGIGTKLLNALFDEAKKNNCPAIHVMTTNDNLDALRFYQRRGFVLSGIYLDVVEYARSLKPSIPALGDYDIPIRDELMLVYKF